MAGAVLVLAGCVDVEETSVPSIVEQLAGQQPEAPAEPTDGDDEGGDEPAAPDEATAARIAEIDDECRRISADMEALEQAQEFDDGGPEAGLGEPSYWYDLRELQREVSDELEAAAEEDGYFLTVSELAWELVLIFTEMAYLAEDEDGEDPEPTFFRMIETLGEAEQAAEAAGFEVCFRSDFADS